MKERHDKSCLPCTSHQALCFSELFKSHRAREGAEVTAGLSHHISLGPQAWTLHCSQVRSAGVWWGLVGSGGVITINVKQSLCSVMMASQAWARHARVPVNVQPGLCWMERERERVRERQIKIKFFPLCSL